MIKKLFILVIITTLTSNYFSQAIVQGYSLMYGGGSYQASNNMPDEEISGASVFYVPINDDVKGSFSSFNLDYFIKLKFKKNLYLKSNVGYCNYSSKTRLYSDLYTFGSPYEWNYEFAKGNYFKESNAGILFGFGLDYKIKNFSIGMNFQYMLFRLWSTTNSKGEDVENFINTNNYQIAPVTSTIVYNNKSTVSFDMEYTLKRFGFKYSYLIASDRPIHQFGITYNLKYDWREVPN
jgi:hypothetical protein